MKYYIFKVTNSRGESYYKLNNAYIGYIDFDSNNTRSTLEYNSKPRISEVTYQLFASGDVKNDRDLHRSFCASDRFDKDVAEQLAEDYKMIVHRIKRKYKVYRPNKNSSTIYLREVGGATTIK